MLVVTAALGLLEPTYAATARALPSSIVVTSSLRLNTFGRCDRRIATAAAG